MSRFGGHETFCVREGWLPKALGLLKSKTDLFKNPLACDHLGVGRNMAKSIDHWLRATCLVKKESRDSNPTITDLGKLILKKTHIFSGQEHGGHCMSILLAAISTRWRGVGCSIVHILIVLIAIDSPQTSIGI